MEKTVEASVRAGLRIEDDANPRSTAPAGAKRAGAARWLSRRASKAILFASIVPLAMGIMIKPLGDAALVTLSKNAVRRDHIQVLSEKMKNIEKPKGYGFGQIARDNEEIRRLYLELGINPDPLMRIRADNIGSFLHIAYDSLPFKKIEIIDFQHSNGQMLKARMYKPAGKGPWPLIVFDAGKDTGVIGKFELPYIAELLARTGYVVYGTKTRMEVAHTEVHDYYAGIEHIWKHYDFVKHETILMGLSAGGAIMLEMAGDTDAARYGVRKVIIMSTYLDLIDIYYYAKEYIRTHDPDDHRTKVLKDYIDYTEELLKTPKTHGPEYKRASPRYYTHDISPDIPILILHGLHDEIVPLDRGISLYNHLKSEGKDVTLRILPGQTVHADFDEMLKRPLEAEGMAANMVEIRKFLKADDDTAKTAKK